MACDVRRAAGEVRGVPSGLEKEQKEWSRKRREKQGGMDELDGMHEMDKPQSYFE